MVALSLFRGKERGGLFINHRWTLHIYIFLNTNIYIYIYIYTYVIYIYIYT